jgi:glycosyltransferase involved in cell wall biosynthesis
MTQSTDSRDCPPRWDVLYHHRTQGRGVEGVHIMTVVDGLRAAGHKCVIASPPGADPEAQLGDAGQHNVSRGPWQLVSEHLPQVLFEGLEIGYNLSAWLRLRQLMRQHPVDVYYERYALFLFAGTNMMYRRGIPVVLEVNDSAWVKRVRPLCLTRFARRIERTVFQRADALIVITEAFKNILVDAGADADRIHVIQNTADTDKFRPDIKPAALPWTDAGGAITTIGFLGKAVPWHGVDHLLSVCLDLMDDHDDLRVVIVGDTSGHPELRQIAGASGHPGNIHFTGQVPHEQAPAYVAAMDIAVMPNSNAFGSPVKLFEYMAMRKAIIAPRLAPVAEILDHQREALLVEPLNDGELRRALQTFVDNVELRQRLGAAAQDRFARDFSPEAHRRKTRAVIDAARLVQRARKTR